MTQSILLPMSQPTDHEDFPSVRTTITVPRPLFEFLQKRARDKSEMRFRKVSISEHICEQVIEEMEAHGAYDKAQEAARHVS